MLVYDGYREIVFDSYCVKSTVINTKSPYTIFFFYQEY